MTPNITAPAADFLACYPFQCDAHTIAWRFWMWREHGVQIKSNGRRYDRRGQPIDGGML